jgi:hypothetical protein
VSTQANQNKKQMALGFVLLAVILYGGYLLSANHWSLFSTVDPKLALGIIAATATVIVSLVSVLISKHLVRKAQILDHLCEKKLPTYEKIIHFILGLNVAKKLGKKQPTDKEMMEFMDEVTQELVICGTDEMIDAFYKFRMKSIDSGQGGEQNPNEILYTVTNLLLAIRKDLGHSPKNMP